MSREIQFDHLFLGTSHSPDYTPKHSKVDENVCKLYQ